MSGQIMLTGATGFIGKALVPALAADGLVATTRDGSAVAGAARTVRLDLAAGDFAALDLSGISTVVHQAGLAYTPDRTEADFEQLNTRATAALAARAAESGVRRFVYLSTINVNGPQSQTPFTAEDTPAPYDAYSRSKLRAEEELRRIAQAAGMEFVIIRPTLVYGAGCKGNFASLLKIAARNLPLPLGAIHNHRSFVGIDNLVDLIVHSTRHPGAANRVLLAADGQDVSTTQLLQTMTRACGKRPLLLPVPAGLLRTAASLLGKGTAVDKLCGNLQVDISATREALQWTPPVSFQEGIRRCYFPQ